MASKCIALSLGIAELYCIVQAVVKQTSRATLETNANRQLGLVEFFFELLKSEIIRESEAKEQENKKSKTCHFMVRKNVGIQLMCRVYG